ncbi:hypothetical protein RJ639_015163 [Escallonia herrerae]|uniref:Uncharacterized protein n=1 Tax=Escallonia herrerae TaxID=1293975 RepID=A0AA88VQH3_9ASTE|nr:hypothetical protein RJ639_015163 [Escallonia herrerae]
MAVPWNTKIWMAKMVWAALTGWIMACLAVADEIASSLRAGDIGPFHLDDEWANVLVVVRCPEDCCTDFVRCFAGTELKKLENKLSPIKVVLLGTDEQKEKYYLLMLKSKIGHKECVKPDQMSWRLKKVAEVEMVGIDNETPHAFRQRSQVWAITKAYQQPVEALVESPVALGESQVTAVADYEVKGDMQLTYIVFTVQNTKEATISKAFHDLFL